MMAVLYGARLTVMKEPPIEGTVRGFPLSSKKLTGNDTAPVPVLVKYSAEYQPPPKANVGEPWKL